jgi:hypothetical protein
VSPLPESISTASSSAPSSLTGTARIEATTFALCNALAAHRPDPGMVPSEQGIASLRDSLLEEIPESDQTEDVVASMQRVAAHLMFGLGNVSHRALNRAYAELEKSLAQIGGVEPGHLMASSMRVGAHLLKREDGPSPLQGELIDLATAAFGNALHASPPTINADVLERLALSGNVKDQVRAAAQRVFQPALKRLADAGLCPAPVFHTYRKRTPEQGWKPVEDFGKFETQADIVEALMRPRPDDVSPLPRLAILHGDVHQTLDREKGHLAVRFPATSGGKVKATETTLKIPAISDSKDPIQRASQDAALDVLDRFCAASFGEAESLWSLRPPAITLDGPGQKIRVGELAVATLTQDAWSMDADAASHVAEVLAPPARRAERPVHEWAGPRVPLARSKCPPGNRDLRLIVQVEDDPIVRDNAASRQLAHPHESVWIQVDTQGRQRILAGDHLLDALPADARIKVEVHGHGGRVDLTDQRSLAGRCAEEIAGLLSEMMAGLGLFRTIDAVDLTSCALATPVFPRCFAEEVLRAGHDLTLFRSSAEITAYADALTFSLYDESLEKLAPRRTLFAESSTGDIHAPGKSLAYSLERGTGKLIVRDKHPEVAPDRTATRATARLHEPSPFEDTTDLPAVSPWRVRGPGMAI